MDSDRSGRVTRPTYRFDEPGTLRSPGPIGRIVRLALGLPLVWVVYQLLFFSGPEDMTHWSFHGWALFALWVFPAVVNIGLGRVWGTWPLRVMVGVVGTTAAVVGHFIHGVIVGPALWWVAVPWMAYTLGHLGISFVLAAIIATPGCEMRAIPHLAGLVTGRRRAEHYCPGFLDRLDRWESS